MEELNSKMSEMKVNKDINDEELEMIVKNMRIKDDRGNIEEIKSKINRYNNLTQKCVYVRELLSPQSTTFQHIVMNDLGINKPINNTSGDGCKNNINYEIKTSIHAKDSNQNFVQIRPDHDIHFYILISYNLYDKTSPYGKAFILKIPSSNLYDLVIKYGGYAHGTCKKLGNITNGNIKGRNCEYSLRCSPNTTKGKNFVVWNELLKYEVDYIKENF